MNDKKQQDGKPRPRASESEDKPATSAEESDPASNTLETAPTSTSGEQPQPQAGQLRSGERLGRYTILEVVGRGGMGVVYRAHDPDLDRLVAIKVLRSAPIAGLEEHDSSVTRLLREAQAMAQLSHPNVLPVFDVGMAQDRVFLATEFIQGQTLAQWLRQQPRGWREVVRIFVAAGAGLQAAHQAGLVHRDFKPHNVLISDDGHVRVTDFGLARRIDADSEAATSRPPAARRPGSPAPSAGRGPSIRSSESPLDQHLTTTGTVVGTLPYVAPELEGGQRSDAASDQYAFCVALYEGLYGSRPFQGRGAPLSRAKALERYAELEADALKKVPKWLDTLVRRGLAPDPSKRWPSMAALLEELSRRPARRRRRQAIALASVALLTMGATAAAVVSTKEHKTQACVSTSDPSAPGCARKPATAPMTIAIEKSTGAKPQHCVRRYMPARLACTVAARSFTAWTDRAIATAGWKTVARQRWTRSQTAGAAAWPAV